MYIAHNVKQLAKNALFKILIYNEYHELEKQRAEFKLDGDEDIFNASLLDPNGSSLRHLAIKYQNHESNSKRKDYKNEHDTKYIMGVKNMYYQWVFGRPENKYAPFGNKTNKNMLNNFHIIGFVFSCSNTRLSKT